MEILASMSSGSLSGRCPVILIHDLFCYVQNLGLTEAT